MRIKPVGALTPSTFSAWRSYFALILFVLTCAALAQDIGSIERVSGAVSIAAGGNVREAQQNELVREGDVVTTATGAEALIKMRDNALFALRQNSEFRFTEYKFDNRASDSSLTHLLKGAVRTVSGLIGKAQPARVRLTTPTATIGIRGTDYEVTVVTEDTPAGQAGTYNLVNDGATTLELSTGERIDVTREQTGFAPAQILQGVARVLLLREKPTFFQGGIFDNVLIQLAAQLITQRAQQEIQNRMPIPSIPGVGNIFDIFNRRRE